MNPSLPEPLETPKPGALPRMVGNAAAAALQAKTSVEAHRDFSFELRAPLRGIVGGSTIGVPFKGD